ncbi:MAG TPA: class I SAM-dependent RNA methyltransferase, partial [Blastocatellia bacterium]|nr:class I SAM-dependent RNA methyltransferase [Blastocatellia bacterium]
FFQGNRFQIERLVATTIGDESGSLALDLYSGVGLFTLPLARRFERVIGVEESRFAVEFANRNAETAGLGNVEFVAEPVRRFLAESDLAGVDLVLLDPPRAGTEADTIMNLIALNPRVVSYVSCEPSVLARDLKRFVESGYRIEKITAIDLFPQTHHVETIARLVSPSA